MKQVMSLQSAFSEPTKSFEAGNVSAVTATDKTTCVVLSYEDHAQPPIKTPANHQSIEDLMAELSTDSAFHAEFEKARTWIADEFYADDADTIRTLRLRKGWSQTQLAQKLGTRQSHVARIERGSENVLISTCRKLCQVFNIDMNTLDALLKRQEAIFAEKCK